MKELLKTRFFVGWLSASAVMFSISYLWHGVILNDFTNLSYPLTYFLTLCTIVYLVIGFALSFAFGYLQPRKKLGLKGIALGGALGFFIYLIAFTLGVSFKSNGIEHIVVDFIWQMAEQATGGFIVGVVYFIAARREELLKQEI